MRIALTLGEPAGIGPDIVADLAGQPSRAERVVIGDPEVLTARARTLGLAVTPYPFAPAEPPRAQGVGEIAVAPVTSAAPVIAGRLDPSNAASVIEALDRARNGCRDGTFDALVTGPVHKGVINEAGVAFSGHTEFLATDSATPPVMMLVADTLRVALATTHLPLQAVAAAITREHVATIGRILARDLTSRFAIAAPRLLVLGLNPHAGEGGHLGGEELAAIAPAIDDLQAEGIAASGPWPADTAFTPRHLAGADAVLAMYHDQGLPVLKYAGFGHAVNVTLGLPFIRTSVDHGTALDLAGTGRAEAGSLHAAFDLAVDLAQRAHAA